MKSPNVIASDCLKSWAYLLGGLADNVSTRKTNAGLRCKVVLPSGQNVAAVGEDSSEAVRNLLIELTKQIPHLPGSEHGNVDLAPQEMMTAAPCRVQLKAQSEDEGKLMDAATKARRETIGVTTKKSFHLAIADLAVQRGLDTSAMARTLLLEGWNNFRTRRINSDPDLLLDSYEKLALSYRGMETKQWMVRVDRKLAIKVQLAAKEYERSSSFIASCLLAEGLQLESSTAVQTSPELPVDAAAVKRAVAQISDIRGPAARELARKVGLGEQRVLMNQVLSGAVITPIKVQQNVAVALGLPLEVLSAALNECFNLQTVSGFKAQDGKPQVRIEPETWEEAVIGLKLSPDEEMRLLSLDQ
jgi:hypothetical protein